MGKENLRENSHVLLVLKFWKMLKNQFAQLCKHRTHKNLSLTLNRLLFIRSLDKLQKIYKIKRK